MSRLNDSLYFEWSADGLTDGGAALALDGYTVSATFTSAPTYLKSVDAYSVVITCPATGTPSATVSLQGSNDVSTREIRGQAGVADVDVANWFTIPFVNQSTGAIVTSQTVSGASTLVFAEPKCTYRWVRIAWTNSSGSAIVTATIQLKGIV